MKKTLIKYLSAFLVLVLIISILPMAAFATENEPETCAICAHPRLTKSQYDPICVDTGATTHTWYKQYVVYCPDCGYSAIQRGAVMYSTSHRYDENQTTLPKVCIDCAHVK